MDPNAPVPQGENVAPAPVPEPVAPPAPEPVTPPTMPNPPVDQPPAPPPAPQTPPEPVKKTSPIFTVALILLLLTILILGGYYVWTNYLGGHLGDRNNVSVTASPVTLATPIPTTDPTLGWKTYFSKEKDFSFKYPSEWVYGEDNSFSSRKGLKIYLRPKEPTPTDPSYGAINIWIFSNKTFNEYVASELCESPGVCAKPESAETIKLGEIDAMLFKDLGGPLPSDVVVANNNNVIVEFDFSYEGGNKEDYSNREEKIVFDQILSTFKFTEASTSATSSPSATP